jgi:hypothetical protein
MRIESRGLATLLTKVLFSLVTYFEKIERAYEIALLCVCVCVCVCVCLYPPINFWTPEPIFIKLDTYPISRHLSPSQRPN